MNFLVKELFLAPLL